MTAPGAPAAPGGNDKTTLFGVLGIILAICCWPAGLVFAILSLNESKKHRSSPGLAYAAFAVIGIVVLLNIVGLTQGWFSF